ncbi:MAG TPA: HAMP domain-containing sensor histidine kinase [Candidatus Dormibacteraeota bacterium]|nr:HAMP domain-containing sensor histidine kinase [Candidatus Dormibacteraeota bacterium]
MASRIRATATRLWAFYSLQLTLRMRVALLSSLAVFVVVGLLGVGVFFEVSAQLYDQVNDDLIQYQTTVLRSLHRPDRFNVLPQGTNSNSFAILFADDDEAVRASVNGNDLKLDHVPRAAWEGTLNHGTPASLEIRTSEGTALIRMTRAYSSDHAGPEVLVVGQWLGTLQNTLNILRLTLITGCGLALLAAGGLSWLIADRSLQPISSLTQATELIGASDDLSRRLPPPNTRDELARLTVSFNDSLDRLEDAYKALEDSLSRQRRFVADASHELRSPLTVILNDAENLLDHPEVSEAERREVLSELVYETKRMAELSTSLLQLARGDAGAPMEVAAIDWQDFYDLLRHDAERLCAPRPVTAEPAGRLGSGSGDLTSLRAAFRVFLDNIERHTPRSTRVLLEASASGTEVRFLVADNGPGVSSNSMPRIFDRFYRADRSRLGKGSGLGLAIARSMIERHGGSVTAVRRQPRGLGIEVTLPRRQEAVVAVGAESGVPDRAGGKDLA